MGGPSCELCTDNYVQIPTEQFGQNGDTFLTTDEYGMAVLEVQGKRQSREISDSAEPWDREFTVQVHAQPEAITGDHIFDAFFAGFSSPNPFGFLQAILISLKEKRWDLGEYTYPIRDWREGCAGGSANSASETLAEVMEFASQGEALPCFYLGDVNVRHDGAADWSGLTTTGTLSGLRFELDPEEGSSAGVYRLVEGTASVTTSGTHGDCSYEGETHIERPTPSADNPYLVGTLWILSEDREFTLAMTAGDFYATVVECDDGDGSYTYNENNFVRVSLEGQPFVDASSLSGSADFLSTHGGRNTLDQYEYDLTGGSCEPSPEPICTLDTSARAE